MQAKEARVLLEIEQEYGSARNELLIVEARLQVEKELDETRATAQRRVHERCAAREVVVCQRL